MKKNYNLLLFSLSQLVTTVGDNLRWLAWPIFVFNLTESAIYLPIAALGDEFGALLGSFFSGKIAGKYNIKKLMII